MSHVKLCLGHSSCSGECGHSKTSGRLLNVEIAAVVLEASGYLSKALSLAILRRGTRLLVCAYESREMALYT